MTLQQKASAAQPVAAPRKKRTGLIAALIVGIVLLLGGAGVVSYMMFKPVDDPRFHQADGVQYPAGQRPCNESLTATDRVAQARLAAGTSFEDPTGDVSAALEAAREPLSYRAGASQYYDAAAYDRAAAGVTETLDPYITALAGEDPDTPYNDNSDAVMAASNRYDEAVQVLSTECTT